MKVFKDKVAVVTGAASGIGKALAFRFSEEGMKVVMADVEKGALDQASSELKAKGGQVLPVLCDVSVAEEVEALAKTARDSMGAVHVLCNNAGVGNGGLIWNIPLNDWKWVLGVNLWGVIHGIRFFVPDMIKQGTEGHIVNTASLAGLITVPNLGPYQATKHAVVGISETLYRELALTASKLKVSVLCPGIVNTRIGEAGRNRPDFAPAQPESSAMSDEAGRKLMAMGMAPAKVADQVFNAIQEDKFWVLTHPEADPVVRLRMESVLERRNPETGFGQASKIFGSPK